MDGVELDRTTLKSPSHASWRTLQMGPPTATPSPTQNVPDRTSGLSLRRILSFLYHLSIALPRAPCFFDSKNATGSPSTRNMPPSGWHDPTPDRICLCVSFDWNVKPLSLNSSASLLAQALTRESLVLAAASAATWPGWMPLFFLVCILQIYALKSDCPNPEYITGMRPFNLSFWQNTAKPPVNTDPTLDIWYDFADSSTITLGTGTEITSVADKSTGSIKPANSTGGKRPKQSTNFQNGKNVAFFDGVNDLFTINPLDNFKAISGTSMMVVGKFNNADATNTMTQIGLNNAQRNECWLSIRNGVYQIGMGQGLATTSAAATTDFHIFTAVFDGTKTGNANRLKFRLDGVDTALTFSQNVSTATATDNPTWYFYIGTAFDESEDLNGYIGELLLYTRAINTTEMINTENYLKAKWGIT